MTILWYTRTSAYNQPTTLWLDNQSTIKMIKNPEFHHRQKHIDIKKKYIREKHGEGTLVVKYVPTNDQLADFLIKGLAAPNFKSFLERLTSVFGSIETNGQLGKYKLALMGLDVKIVCRRGRVHSNADSLSWNALPMTN